MTKNEPMFSRARRIRRRVTALTFIACTIAGTAMVTAPAASASPVQNCQVVLGQTAAPGTASPVLSTQCAPAGRALAAPAASTLLMTWYDGYNFSGNSTKYYGAYGPCDNLGYGIPWVGTAWNDRIRSWRMFNNCVYSSAFLDINYGGSYCGKYKGAVADGSYMDAQISSFWISKDTHAWAIC